MSGTPWPLNWSGCFSYVALKLSWGFKNGVTLLIKSVCLILSKSKVGIEINIKKTKRKIYKIQLKIVWI